MGQGGGPTGDPVYRGLTQGRRHGVLFPERRIDDGYLRMKNKGQENERCGVGSPHAGYAGTLWAD